MAAGMNAACVVPVPGDLVEVCPHRSAGTPTNSAAGPSVPPDVQVCVLPVPAHDQLHDMRAQVSPAELAYCLGFERVAEHLAARVAGKQAVAAVLGWTGPVPWRSIEILRQPGRPPVVTPTGPFDEWRRAVGLPVPGVSLTHTVQYAAALAWLPAPGVLP
jgi:holo-[acyl-carrier protein] synthase